MKLRDLRSGALFATGDGEMVVKSEYHHADGRPLCIMLETGEYTGESITDDTKVKEIPPEVVAVAPDLARLAVLPDDAPAVVKAALALVKATIAEAGEP